MWIEDPEKRKQVFLGHYGPKPELNNPALALLYCDPDTGYSQFVSESNERVVDYAFNGLGVDRTPVRRTRLFRLGSADMGDAGTRALILGKLDYPSEGQHIKWTARYFDKRGQNGLSGVTLGVHTLPTDGSPALACVLYRSWDSYRGHIRVSLTPDEDFLEGAVHESFGDEQSYDQLIGDSIGFEPKRAWQGFAIRTGKYDSSDLPDGSDVFISRGEMRFYPTKYSTCVKVRRIEQSADGGVVLWRLYAPRYVAPKGINAMLEGPYQKFTGIVDKFGLPFQREIKPK